MQFYHRLVHVDSDGVLQLSQQSVLTLSYLQYPLRTSPAHRFDLSTHLGFPVK